MASARHQPDHPSPFERLAAWRNASSAPQPVHPPGEADAATAKVYRRVALGLRIAGGCCILIAAAILFSPAPQPRPLHLPPPLDTKVATTLDGQPAVATPPDRRPPVASPFLVLGAGAAVTAGVLRSRARALGR